MRQRSIAPGRTARTPRVLLVCDHLVRYTCGLGQGLRDQAADVALVTRDHAECFGGDLLAMRGEIRERLGEGAPVWWLRGRVRDRAALPDARSVARSVHDWAPQVVHVQDSVVHDPRLVWAAHLRPRRFAVTVHDPTPHPGDIAPSPSRRVAREALLALAGCVFVHSAQLAVQLRESTRVPLPPIEVVPHGTDARAPVPLPQHPTLLFFGRMSRYKGLDVLLRAMPTVWRHVPAARLIVAGHGPLPDDALLADARVELRNEHIPEAEIPRLFERASVVTLPYVQASQSGVGSQAKAFARPVIASATGSLPDLVADGSGLLVPPDDAAALAEAAVMLLSDPARACRMGRLGAQTAAELTSWESVAGVTLDAYRRHLLA